MAAERLRIEVRGTVQGVGFRPYVYGLATGLGLAGYVCNTARGVTIEVEGEDVEAFLQRLPAEVPPLARITAIDAAPVPSDGAAGFHITESADGGSFTLVSPDVATCEDCLRELRDPGDRRFRYPFITCTNCGPRYTITKKVPYDRPTTTMEAFTMCPECLGEYTDPTNRRFHSVPNACRACGPSVRLLSGGLSLPGDEAVGEAIRLLQRGSILAVKGLGGFHLACNARDALAVERLRERKRRSNKPFALMARDLEAVRRFCHVTEAEEDLLRSPARPIVLLRKRPGCALPEAISPANARLGFMLPYTPLHELIMEGLEVAVMSSGNRADEPIQIDGGEAGEALRDIAEGFLVHDREIFMRTDDSVAACPRGCEGPVFIRRARGYAPAPIALTKGGPEVLGAGADIKNTFTLLKDDQAVVSQHIGDMENAETLGFFEEALRNLSSVYRAAPAAIAHDLHPGYFSTRWALRQKGCRLVPVQHHHAHVASVMAEWGLEGPVIGAALDGAGYGTDGTLWGGEFLVAEGPGFRRAGHFCPLRLPGGEQAVREPWRVAAAWVGEVMGEDAEEHLAELGFFDRYGEKRVRSVLRISTLPEFSPLSSGAGRLFDAVSALLGLCDLNTFEGEAPMALEAQVEPGVEDAYSFRILPGDPFRVDFSGALIRIIGDMRAGTGVGVVAARLHKTVAAAVLAAVEAVSAAAGLRVVALSGGSFQNEHLLASVRAGLEARGLAAYHNRSVPLNDGGVSLGQAWVARAVLRAERT
jgi:hydrogenase maturation protein HypF